MSATYSVLGMSCGGCATSVTKAIQTTAPNAFITVDLNAHEITVKGADEADVKTAVTDAGFEYAGPIIAQERP